MSEIEYPPRKTYSARLRERGQLTVPQPVREALSLNEGDLLTFLPVGDALLLTPRAARTPALAEEFSRIMDEEGVSLAELLAGLEEERESSAGKRLTGHA